MKKFLAVLLATLMVLSALATCIVLPAAAEEASASGANVIEITDGTDAATAEGEAGWQPLEVEGLTASVVTVGKDSAAVDAYGLEITTEITGVWTPFAYLAKDPSDLTGMEYVQFDLYLADYELVAGKDMVIEVASSATGDNGELQFSGRVSLANGWNTVRIPLSRFVQQPGDTFDKAAFNRFRVFFNTEDVIAQPDAEAEEGDDPVYYAIKDLQFNNGLGEFGAELLPNSITVSGCAADSKGHDWSGNTGLSSPDAPEQNGSASITWTAGQKLTGHGAFHASFSGKRIEDEFVPVDATGAKYFVFEVYLDDISALSEASFMFELTSAGQSDKEESNTTVQWAKLTESGTLVEGWNTCKVDISTMGNGCDWTRVNFWRMYNTVDIAFTVDTTCAIDYARFEDADGNVIGVLYDAAPDMAGWNKASNAQAMFVKKFNSIDVDDETGEETENWSYEAVMGQTLGAGERPGGSLVLAYTNPDNQAFDISNMKFMEFDFYISDASVLQNGGNLMIELSSSGKSDSQEINYLAFTDGKGFDLEDELVDGWNHIQLPLSLFTGVNNDGGQFDPYYFNFFRMYNAATWTCTEDTVIAIDNLTFGSGMDTLKTSGRGEVMDERSSYTFAPGSDDEGAYLVSDEDGVKTYKFTVNHADTTDQVSAMISIAGAPKISVSYDDIAYDTVFEYGFNAGDYKLPAATRYFNFTEYVVDSVSNTLLSDTVYVRIEGDYELTGKFTLTNVHDVVAFNAVDNYTFTGDTEKELEYLIDPGTGISNPAHVRYADDTATIIYKFPLIRTENIDTASFVATIRQQYHIWASTDGENWVEIAKYEGEDKNQVDVRMTLDLSALDLTGTVEAIWIKIGDSVLGGGYGGAISCNVETTLSVSYIDVNRLQTKKLAHRVDNPDMQVAENERDGGYLYSIEANVGFAAWGRFADKVGLITYKYETNLADPIKTLTWTAHVNGDLELTASADGENWVAINTEAVNSGVMTFNLAKIISAVNETGTVYVRIGDNTKDGGGGGQIHNDADTVLSIGYVPMTDAEKDLLEATGDEHTIPFFGANQAFGAFQPDFVNQTAGSACVSAVWTNGMVNQYVLDNPIDVSAMDTFEFEMYISDLSFFDEVTFGGGDSLELTSSGTCDKEESNYGVGNFIKKEDAVVGWNHVAIPLASMGGGECDWTRVNFLRIFWVSASPDKTEKEYIIKFDNFRFTDAQAQAKAKLEAEKAEFDAANGALVEQLKALDAYKSKGNFNEENYETAKAAIAAAATAYEALSEDAKRVATDAGYYTYLEKAQTALGKYEDELKEIADLLAANQALIDAINALTAEINAENYETALAAYDAAFAQYDALKSSEKRTLNEETGVGDKLEAVKAALDAYVPGDSTGDNTGDGTGDNTGDNTGDDAEDKGCKSVLTVGATAMMLVAAAYVAMVARKKED